MEKENNEKLIDIGDGIFLTREDIEAIKEAEAEIERGEGLEISIALEEFRKRIEAKKAKNRVDA
ncbi:MAG: hypothetical protein IJW20_03620 [Clostridia bacterium]|nr:hypothetical protein [Clostridia bacterium]